MITQLFINFCILITVISLYYIFIKNKDIHEESIAFKILLGVGGGLLGILLMMFSVKITPRIITDFRMVPILLCSFYGGFSSPIIASLLIGFFRIVNFGVSNESVIAVIVILLAGTGFSIIKLIKTSKIREWMYCVIYLLIINIIPIILLVKDQILFVKVLTIFLSSNLLIYYIIFEYTDYLNENLYLYKKFKNEASIDYLTGLYNVRQFNMIFKKSAQKAIRNNEYLSLLFLDIDYYKKVNDNYGHSAGDIILKDIALILKKTCREYDIISRNGGEEFTVLLINCETKSALEVAGRIRKNVSEHKFYISDKVSINITVSIGISTYPNLTKNIYNLLDNADAALYEAKRGGRNKVVLYKEVKVINGL